MVLQHIKYPLNTKLNDIKQTNRHNKKTKKKNKKKQNKTKNNTTQRKSIKLKLTCPNFWKKAQLLLFESKCVLKLEIPYEKYIYFF